MLQTAKGLKKITLEQFFDLDPDILRPKGAATRPLLQQVASSRPRRPGDIRGGQRRFIEGPGGGGVGPTSRVPKVKKPTKKKKDFSQELLERTRKSAKRREARVTRDPPLASSKEIEARRAKKIGQTFGAPTEPEPPSIAEAFGGKLPSAAKLGPDDKGRAFWDNNLEHNELRRNPDSAEIAFTQYGLEAAGDIWRELTGSTGFHAFGEDVGYISEKVHRLEMLVNNPVDMERERTPSEVARVNKVLETTEGLVPRSDEAVDAKRIIQGFLRKNRRQTLAGLKALKKSLKIKDKKE